MPPSETPAPGTLPANVLNSNACDSTNGDRCAFNAARKSGTVFFESAGGQLTAAATFDEQSLVPTNGSPDAALEVTVRTYSSAAAAGLEPAGKHYSDVLRLDLPPGTATPFAEQVRLCFKPSSDFSPSLAGEACMARYNEEDLEWECVPGSFSTPPASDPVTALGAGVLCSVTDQFSYYSIIEQSSGLSGGAIAGIVIGVIAALLIIGALVYWFVIRPRREYVPMPRPTDDGTVSPGRSSTLKPWLENEFDSPQHSPRGGVSPRGTISDKEKSKVELAIGAGMHNELDSSSGGSEELSDGTQVKIARKLRAMAESEQARSGDKTWDSALGASGKKSGKKHRRRHDDDSDDADADPLQTLLQENCDLSLDEAKDNIRESELIDDLLDQYADSDEDSSEVIERLLTETKKSKKKGRSKSSKKDKKKKKTSSKANDDDEDKDAVPMQNLPSKGDLMRQKFAADVPAKSSRD